MPAWSTSRPVSRSEPSRSGRATVGCRAGSRPATGSVRCSATSTTCPGRSKTRRGSSSERRATWSTGGPGPGPSTSPATKRLITQNTSGIPGTAEAGDHFGASLANNQLPPRRIFKQLAIGAPGEDVGSAKDAGSVTVLRRTDTKVYPAVSLTQSTKGVAGTVETGDQFGAAVAYRDDRTLAIGIPGEDLGSAADAGSVQIVRVGKSNLSFPSPSITEDSPGTPGSIAAGSRFGSSVAGLPSTDQFSRARPAATASRCSRSPAARPAARCT